jgi:hypothetical protein
MAWTKRQIVEQAYEAIGIAFYDFDMSPEQMQTGLRALDAMAGTWNGRGVRLGYPLPSSIAAGTLDESAGVPDFAVEALYSNLALRLAPGAGKAISPDLRAQAGSAYKALLSRSAVPIERVNNPNAAPLGQGQKYWRTSRDPFQRADGLRVDAGPDSELDLDP